MGPLADLRMGEGNRELTFSNVKQKVSIRSSRRVLTLKVHPRSPVTSFPQQSQPSPNSTTNWELIIQIWELLGDTLNQSTTGSDIVCMVKRSTLAVVQIMVCSNEVIAQESPGEDLDWGVFVTHSAQVLADSKPGSKLIKINSYYVFKILDHGSPSC